MSSFCLILFCLVSQVFDIVPHVKPGILLFFYPDITCPTAETKMINQTESADNAGPEHADVTAGAIHC